MSCIICYDVHTINLECKHDICIQCIMNIFDGFENTHCPVCNDTICMEDVIRYNPCFRCKNCSADYCSKCNAFLCNDCWEIIHSFKPLNLHLKSSYLGNKDRMKEILAELCLCNQDMKKIESDLSELNNENLKIKSVKITTLEKLHKIFYDYRNQLQDQEIAFEQYIENQSLLKKNLILNQKNKMNLRIESCKSQLYDHYDKIVLPDANYTSNLEYEIVFKDNVFPNIIIFPEQMNEDYVKEANGRQTFYKKGTKIVHRDNDLPAIIYADGAESWYQNNNLHRENDLPAVIRKSGEQLWYQNNKLHREKDFPAIINPNGTLEWYINGILHRNYDKPAKIQAGSQFWYQNGKQHRDNDKPAVVYSSGRQDWYQDGKLHRDNGPAILYNDGSTAWYHFGVKQENPIKNCNSSVPSETSGLLKKIILTDFLIQ